MLLGKGVLKLMDHAGRRGTSLSEGKEGLASDLASSICMDQG